MPKLPYQKIHPGHLFITHSRYDPALYISIWFHCSAYLFAFISNLKVGDPSSCTGHLLPWLMSLEIALLHICRLHNKSWFAFFGPLSKVQHWGERANSFYPECARSLAVQHATRNQIWIHEPALCSNIEKNLRRLGCRKMMYRADVLSIVAYFHPQFF